MITRIVKLEIALEHCTEFESVFSKYQSSIKGQQGCHNTELKLDISTPGRYFTYSTWDSQEDLDNYRKSELFGIIWPTVKKWFSDKPEAWSLTNIEN
jgi:quinol monooxygenase YgiN